MENEKIVYVPLKDWSREDSGYYEPLEDIIYILLSDASTMEATLAHERKHRERRNKPTFKIAMLISSPGAANLLLFLLWATGVYAILSRSVNGSINTMFPFFSLFVVYMLALGCRKYEERVANYITETGI